MQKYQFGTGKKKRANQRRQTMKQLIKDLKDYRGVALIFAINLAVWMIAILVGQKMNNFEIIDTGDNKDFKIKSNGKELDISNCVGYEIKRTAGKSTIVKIIYEVDNQNFKIKSSDNLLKTNVINLDSKKIKENLYQFSGNLLSSNVKLHIESTLLIDIIAY